MPTVNQKWWTEKEKPLLEAPGKSLCPKVGKHPFAVVSKTDIMIDPEEWAVPTTGPDQN